MTDVVTITVTVADINDNLPVFRENRYSAAVPENRPPGMLCSLATEEPVQLPPSTGTSILTVEATDKDLRENATISFSLVGGDVGLFSINCE